MGQRLKLGPSGQVDKGLGQAGGDEGFLSKLFRGVRDGELGSGGQVGKGLEHPDGDEGLLSKLF